MLSSILDASSRPLPPRRQPLSPLRFCLGIIVLLLAILLPYTSYHLFNFASSSLHDVKHPHKLVHHNATAGADELDLVRSYFGAGEGAVQEWDLVASLYYRQQASSSSSSEDSQANESAAATGTHGTPWERLYSDVVISQIDGARMMGKGGKRALEGMAKVVLPGRVIPSLRHPVRNGRTAQLVSSFHLLPSRRTTPTLFPLSTLHTSNDSLQISETSLYPVLPLPYPQGSDPAVEGREWANLLGRGHAIASMLLPGRKPNETEAETDGVSVLEGGELTKEGASLVPLVRASRAVLSPEAVPRMGRADAWAVGTDQNATVVDRTWVAMARDQPVYSTASYLNQTQQVRDRERACQKMGMPASHLEAKCWRMFPEVGHFENISPVGLAPHDLSREDGAGQATGWRYTPYLTSTLGVTGPEDAIALPERKLGATEDEEEPDFAYDWHISFSTVSPGRLAAGTFYHAGFSTLATPSIESSSDPSDWVEALRSILSQPHSSLSTHPFLRFFLGFLELPVVILTGVTTFYYWYTRSFTTGIAIPSELIDAGASLLHSIVMGFAMERWSGVLQWLDVSEAVAMALMVGNLAGRVEWAWGGPGGWVPVGLGRRRETRAERRSKRRDLGEFGWAMRAGLFLIVFFLTNFISPPALISSPPPSTLPTTPPRSFFTANPFKDTDKDRITVESFTSTFPPALWLSSVIPQLLLNHRSRTFAGMFPLTAFLHLAQDAMDIGPRVLAGLGWWRKWDGMQSVRVWSLVRLLVPAVASWQAARLPSISQDGEDEDEGDK